MYVSFWSKVLLNQAPSVCKSIFGKLVCALVGSKIISSSQGDKALSEFTSFHESRMSKKRLAFEKFNTHEQRLDEFFTKQTGNVSYTNLLPILKLVLVLSHGQTNVERCFSVNNNVLKCNMSEKSIMSLKLIIDHMKSHNLLPQSSPLQRAFYRLLDLPDNVMNSTFEKENPNPKMRKLSCWKSWIKRLVSLNVLFLITRKLVKAKWRVSATHIRSRKHNDFLKTKELLSKGTSLKIKSYEKLKKSKKLEEALKWFKKKGKKICNLNSNNVTDYFSIFVGLNFLIYPFWTNVLFCDPLNGRGESKKVKKWNIGSKWFNEMGKLTETEWA